MVLSPNWNEDFLSKLLNKPVRYPILLAGQKVMKDFFLESQNATAGFETYYFFEVVVYATDFVEKGVSAISGIESITYQLISSPRDPRIYFVYVPNIFWQIDWDFFVNTFEHIG